MQLGKGWNDRCNSYLGLLFDTFPSCQTEVCKNHSQRSTKIFFTNKTEVSLNAQCTGEWKKKISVAVLKPYTEEADSRNSACISWMFYFPSLNTEISLGQSVKASPWRAILCYYFRLKQKTLQEIQSLLPSSFSWAPTMGPSSFFFLFLPYIFLLLSFYSFFLPHWIY